MQTFRLLAISVAFLFSLSTIRATSTLPVSLEKRAQIAAAICIGQIAGAFSYRNAEGRIFTQTRVEVQEALKGSFPTTIFLTHRGGVVPGAAERVSDTPRLREGERRLLFLAQRADGSLLVEGGDAGAMSLPGGPFENLLLGRIRALYPDPDAANQQLTQPIVTAGVRRPSVVGGLIETSGVPFRYIHGDRGEPIPYLVDMDALPSGISTNTALTAVSNAFGAWATVTSLDFEFAGITRFGQAAIDITNDTVIRVQLHDTFNRVTNNLQLGLGGSSAIPTSGTGGAVNGQAFGLSVRGFVMLKHTDGALSNPLLLEEVLAHELGHVLGLDHSSATDPESDTSLSEALMYFLAHNDDRGARLENHDRTQILRAYPTNNTPPAAFERVMDAVTHVSQFENPSDPGPQITGINEVTLGAFDLQTTNLSLVLQNIATASGTFSVDGLVVKYNAQGFIGGARLDPLGGFFYNRATVQVSDGTNLSASVGVSVISLQSDSFPNNASDGLPDAWMTSFFGDANPANIAGFSANGDADGDGISNLDEFRIGTVPTSAASALMFLPSTQPNTINFASTIGELYLAETTTNFTNWARAAIPIQATDTNTVISNFLADPGEVGFFRIQRVP